LELLRKKKFKGGKHLHESERIVARFISRMTFKEIVNYEPFKKNPQAFINSIPQIHIDNLLNLFHDQFQCVDQVYTKDDLVKVYSIRDKYYYVHVFNLFENKSMGCTEDELTAITDETIILNEKLSSHDITYYNIILPIASTLADTNLLQELFSIRSIPLLIDDMDDLDIMWINQELYKLNNIDKEPDITEDKTSDEDKIKSKGKKLRNKKKILEEQIEPDPTTDPLTEIENESTLMDPLNESTSNETAQKNSAPNESTLMDPLNESIRDPLNESTTRDPLNESTTRDPLNESTSRDPLNESTTRDPLNESTTRDPLNESTLNDKIFRKKNKKQFEFIKKFIVHIYSLWILKGMPATNIFSYLIVCSLGSTRAHFKFANFLIDLYRMTDDVKKNIEKNTDSFASAQALKTTLKEYYTIVTEGFENITPSRDLTKKMCSLYEMWYDFLSE
jgi:hypothetical protein